MTDDATDPVVAELAAALAAERLRNEHMFELAPVAQLVTDANAKILDANEPAAVVLGAERRSLRGKGLAAYIAPGDRQHFRAQVAGAVGEGSAQFRISLQPRADGDVVVAAAIAATGDGEQLHWLLHDVTAQAPAEGELSTLNRELERRVEERAVELDRTDEALAVERSRFAAVFRQMPGGLIVADAPSGRVLLANDQAVDIFGPGLREISDLDAYAAVAGYAPDGHPLEAGEWPLARAIAGESVAAELIEIVRPDGRRAVIEVSGEPVRAASGVVVAGVVVFHDVTARERREHAEREFVENAAHQLRTPLTAIMSAVEVLQGGAKEEPVARDRFLGHIESQSARLARLARALLILARAQTAQETPDVDLVALAPMLRGIAASLVVAPGVEVVVDCADDVAALGNRDLVEEALASVASNAAHYTARGRIDLVAAPDGDHVLVEVRDTGPGIPPEVRSRIYDRFARGPLDGSEGFGLGLAIAQQAVTATGGSLEVVSPNGEGTTARIRLRPATLVVE